MKNDWFEKICHALPISPERRIWSDGEQIYCKDEAAAETVAELIECLYMMDGKCLQTHTVYYDPAEDQCNGEIDEYSGWYYVSIE